MKNYSKTQKGITLVSIMVTVIVLVILAVVTIRSVNDDGVLSHAEQSHREVEFKLEEKKFNSIVLKYQIGEITLDDLENRLEEYGFEKVSEGKYKGESGNYFFISTEGNEE